MDIEFDPAKDEANKAKHGVSLGFGALLFLDPDYLLISATRIVDGEDRYKLLGMVNGRLWTAIYTVRGSVTRFISVRKSNETENRTYSRSAG